jgi:predicted phosphodiesterase
MKNRLILLFAVMIIGLLSNIAIFSQAKWRFAVLGDTHVPSSDTVREMIPYIMSENVDFILVPGDLVDGGLKCSTDKLKLELNQWLNIFDDFYKSGIKVYAIRGNHEDDATNDIEAWNSVFSGDHSMPMNGPPGEENLSYYFLHKNALFIGLDNYVNIHKVNQNWLNQVLKDNDRPHVFVFGHEAAFKVFHTDCLDDYQPERDEFWQSLINAGVKTYFCGHDHFYNVSLIDDGDGNRSNDIYQCLIGSGGGWLMPKHNLNGDNSKFKPKELIHKIEHGYGVVEISGDGNNDLDVTITWYGRIYNPSENNYKYLPIPEKISYKAESKALSVENTEQNVISICPNPATDRIFLPGISGIVTIYNTIGSAVWKGIPAESGYIEISGLSDGLYFVENYLGTRYDQQAKHIKFIKYK